MASEEYKKAAKAAVEEMAKLVKAAAGQSDAVKQELIPFTAEAAIIGSTHAAEYVDGKDRVEVFDMPVARQEWAAAYWRVAEPEPEKALMAKVLKRKRVRELGGVRLVQGQPSLRLTLLGDNKEREMQDE
jgi:hypothetical protein